MYTIYFSLFIGQSNWKASSKKNNLFSLMKKRVCNLGISLSEIHLAGLVNPSD